MTTLDSHLSDIRHSFAHLLAAAVLKLWPKAKLTIGPSIENGFYYDFDFPSAIGDKDLPKIEKEMKSILSSWREFSSREINEKEAKKIFKGNEYKQELISEIVSKKESITLYRAGDFEDLCRGGHVKNISDLKNDAFILSHTAGAYWRGSEKNKMLTRIYGLAFQNHQALEDYREMQEEAKKRDHRKLGKELELFTVIDEIGPGLPLFYPKGALIRRLVENYITEEQEKRGYVPIWIPHITKGKLYEISGHLDKFDAMYTPMLIDNENYYLKPMNCPHFMMLYRSLPHSYRDLPIRYTATTTTYRYEKSGELSGLTRVRALTQDDCHVFCEREQVEGEISLMLEMIREVYQTFGFNDFWVRVSLRDKNKKNEYIGGDDAWQNAEEALQNVVKKTGWQYAEKEGEAAFYGPKLDFIMKDVLGREWQLSTVQLDFNLPERFKLEYVSESGTRKQPIVIHRAILGSTERFLGILIEHYGGAFPVWLSPVQVKILPIGEGHHSFSEKVYKELKAIGVRVEVDLESESLGKKIRTSKIQKVPYLLVIGDKEVESETVTVESRDGGNLGNQKLGEFSVKIKKEIAERK